MPDNQIALRMDDVGSASKRYEIYGRTKFPLGPFHLPFPGNFLFLKYVKPFRAWGPYPELTAFEWEQILDYCKSQQLKLTVGITAGWVEYSGKVTPFPQKYPVQARILKEANRDGLVEIANHGYTHCILEGNQFRPRLFSSNRKWHREFWDWTPLEIQEKHIAISQDILQSFFETSVETFIPPGNVFTENTLAIAKRYKLRYLSCMGVDGKQIAGLTLIPEAQVIAFHDKELYEHGLDWLKQLKNSIEGKKVRFICNIGQALA